MASYWNSAVTADKLLMKGYAPVRERKYMGYWDLCFQFPVAEFIAHSQLPCLIISWQLAFFSPKSHLNSQLYPAQDTDNNNDEWPFRNMSNASSTLSCTMHTTIILITAHTFCYICFFRPLLYMMQHIDVNKTDGSPAPARNNSNNNNI